MAYPARRLLRTLPLPPLAAAFLLCLPACARKGEAPLEDIAPDVLTTVGAVQSWTTLLLEDIAEPRLLLEPEIQSALEKEKLSPSHPIPPALRLVAWGGDVDEDAREAFRKFHPEEEARVVVLTEESEPDTWTWLDPRKVPARVEILAGGLVSIFPENEAAIEERAGELQERIRVLAGRYENFFGNMSPPPRILTDTENLRPLLEYLGFDVVAVFPGDPRRMPSESELDAFSNAVRESGVTLLVSGTGLQKPGLFETASELSLQIVRVNPMLEGSMGPMYYTREFEENVERLALQVNLQTAAESSGAR